MSEAFQFFLNDISQSFLDGNLALWRSRLILPFSLITKVERTVLETEDAVAKNFGLYLKARDALGVEVAVRTPVALEHNPDGTWVGTFQTRLLRNEALIAPPYTSKAIMRLIDNRYRMSSFVNARGHYEWKEGATAQ